MTNIEFLEEKIPQNAKSVFALASFKALENDLNIMEVDGNSLYEIDSNGNKTFIKKIKSYKIEEKSFTL